MLAVPVHGCINAHASILPKYRGAAPINRAILDGEKETGVTVMHMAKECDAGDMILVKKQAIRPDETAEDLFKELAVLGADAIAEAIVEIQNGTAQRVPQDESQATYAPMLSRELSPIDWTRSSTQIIDQIRALIPWPCAAASILGANTKIFRCRAARRNEGRAWHAVRAQKGHRSRLRRRQKHSHHGAAARRAASAWQRTLF